jgi:hypothetical protein
MRELLETDNDLRHVATQVAGRTLKHLPFGTASRAVDSFENAMLDALVYQARSRGWKPNRSPSPIANAK